MKLKESETLELKKSTSELKEALVSIAAILNKHKKGVLYFGIKNTGEAIGQTVSENTLREISKAISDHIEPKIFPKISEITIKGKECVKVEFSGGNMPYFARGRAYIRVADEDRQLSAKELERIIIEKNKEKLRWDSEICKDAEISDISSKILKWFLNEAGKEYPSVENSLTNLGLMKDKKLLNTAILLFGKNPQKFFQNAKLRCAVFATDDTSIILDRQEFQGGLFYLIEKAEEYILKNIHIGMRLEGLRRIDVPEIDKDAFREAIINAFCHRDYYQYDSINIAIFKDRIEIRSPGGLYGGLTIEQIKQEQISKRRNEIIAAMLHEVHFMEKWGRGIRLILSNEPTADFKVVAEMFITTFKRTSAEKETRVVTTPKTTLKTEEQILSFLGQNPKLTKEALAKKIGITIDGIKYHIKKLRKKGKIKWAGPTKGGYWEIIKK